MDVSSNQASDLPWRSNRAAERELRQERLHPTQRAQLDPRRVDFQTFSDPRADHLVQGRQHRVQHDPSTSRYAPYEDPPLNYNSRNVNPNRHFDQRAINSGDTNLNPSPTCGTNYGTRPVDLNVCRSTGLRNRLPETLEEIIRVNRPLSKLPSADAKEFRNMLFSGTLIQKFKGDTSKFWGWYRSIEIYMSKAELAIREILVALARNTEGGPLEEINHIQHLNMEDSECAVRTLWLNFETSYGDNERNLQVLLREIKDFPAVTGRNLSDLTKLKNLFQKLNTMLSLTRHMSDVERLGSGHGLTHIAEKLPIDLKRKWYDLILDRRDSRVEPPGLEILTDMIKTYHRRNMYTESQIDAYKRDEARNVKTRVLKTDVNVDREIPGAEKRETTTNTEQTKACVFHKSDSHETRDCQSFSKAPVETRKKLVIEAFLCFKCLGRHFARDCDQNISCERCSRNHATGMHNVRLRDTPVTNTNASEESKSKDDNKKVTTPASAT